MKHYEKLQIKQYEENKMKKYKEDSYSDKRKNIKHDPLALVPVPNNNAIKNVIAIPSSPIEDDDNNNVVQNGMMQLINLGYSMQEMAMSFIKLQQSSNEQIKNIDEYHPLFVPLMIQTINGQEIDIDLLKNNNIDNENNDNDNDDAPFDLKNMPPPMSSVDSDDDDFANALGIELQIRDKLEPQQKSKSNMIPNHQVILQIQTIYAFQAWWNVTKWRVF